MSRASHAFSAAGLIKTASKFSHQGILLVIQIRDSLPRTPFDGKAAFRDRDHIATAKMAVVSLHTWAKPPFDDGDNNARRIC
jgi:hypothetical protein